MISVKRSSYYVVKIKEVYVLILIIFVSHKSRLIVLQ